MKKTAQRTKHDWSRVDAMTDEERHAAAMADPDARPMTVAEWARMKPVPRVSIIRRAFRLSQEEFAAQFHIPIGTLRDWEQGHKSWTLRPRLICVSSPVSPRRCARRCCQGRSRGASGPAAW